MHISPYQMWDLFYLDMFSGDTKAVDDPETMTVICKLVWHFKYQWWTYMYVINQLLV